jgi:undecaprenyl-phosphate galactose phosphotransferase
MKFPAYKYVLGFLDWVTINVAFIVAVKVHADSSSPAFYSTPPFVAPEFLVFMLIAGAALAMFQYNNLYKINVILSVADHLVRLTKSILYLVFVLAILSFFIRSPLIIDSRLVVMFFSVICMSCLIVMRLIVFRYGLKFLVHYNLYQRNGVIIGAGRIGRLVAAHLSFDNPYGVRILGFLDDSFEVGTPVFQGLRVRGKADDIGNLSNEYALDEIFVCVDQATAEELLDILEKCQRTEAHVKIVSPLYDIIPTFRFTERYGELPVVGLAQTTPGAVQEFYKKLFDTVLAAVGLVILSPVFFLIGVAIKLDSAGPVFYRQVRIGKNGRPFIFYKFRSMIIGSDDDDNSRREKVAQFIRSRESPSSGSTKIVDVSKITRLGRFIRKTSIDELPQLFNVIKGDMSLVGPRPCLPYEWEHYEEWHKKRLSVMPGCTGVWQVSGRSAVGFNDMVILDFYYIQNSSLFLDIQLILKTIPVMVFGRGAH